ncbi:aminotransferase class V-fold PLP-dependent enzyme [Clostridium sp. D2Q-11]|uniref:Aminotransferase class V-fold PLP-dependent enzyme n=1 Tax=Anaeromonas frigoriresistens TaxID=2683708 RepID=A0A942UUN5_9FIRM|nr:aminotransferase class V-fold PLP-dependent enzyme [Anaeromonas frigoriresistens]MBS4537805.1 aminotransferase class V-fold PLP-dependent enzyme [Anaeromonas frigoriresistens]
MFTRKYSINNIRKYISGIDQHIKGVSYSKGNYTNFDNAASTPPLLPVVKKIENFSKYYSSIHRGVGLKSIISTEIFENARETTLNFVNANSKKNICIFVKNTTEAINKLSYRLNLSKDDIVLVSLMEHHSNDLPWRNKCRRMYIKLLENGRLDLDDLEYKLKYYKNKIKLVSVTGASNVTGYINDIHRIAKLSHQYNTKIFVDCAQLIPHRKVNMSGTGNDDHLDFIAFSAHKMYAPFGAGVLIGPKDIFNKGVPEYVGGGTIISVTENNEYWAQSPEKDEAGTPNVLGALALMESINILQEIGMEKVKKHENVLTEKLVSSLKTVDNIKLYTSINNINPNNHLGVITFNIKNIPHNLLASLLSFEGNIGVRSGCFCAHPYVHRLLNLSTNEVRKTQQKMLFGDIKDIPGLVRVSFGMYNTISEIDEFVNFLKLISKNIDSYKDQYIYNKGYNCYFPRDFILKDILKSL